MKYTALVREIVTRDVRIVFTAQSKGQARRLLMTIAAHPHRHKQGIVSARTEEATPLPGTIEPLTAESAHRIQRELRR